MFPKDLRWDIGLIILTRNEFKRYYGRGWQAMWKILVDNYRRLPLEERVAALERKVINEARDYRTSKSNNRNTRN